MSTQEQRERFEAAQRPRTDLAKNRRGDYTNPVLQHCWRTWQAAEAAAIKRCAKVVRSEELCDAGDTADDIAYNHAIDHAEQTIRALLPKEE